MARPKGTPHQQIARDRIRTGALLKRLQGFALGECDMNSGQVRATIALLKKTIPDLSAVEHSGTVTRKTVREMTLPEIDERLDQIARRRGALAAGEAAADQGSDEPSPVH